MFRKTIALAALGAALIAPWHQAQAQATGSTAVSIDFPNIVILHYFSTLTLTFTGDSFDDVDEGASTPAGVALADPAVFTAAIDGTTGGPSIPGSLDVTVENAWAIRGISTDGTITVAASIDTAAATNGTSTATMSNLIVDDGSSSGASIDVDAPGFVTPAIGDINFDLDISAVTTAQTHTGMQYTITASAP